MTALPSRLGRAAFEAESSWAESTDTFTQHLQLLGEPIMPSDIQSRIDQGITQQYSEEGKLGVRGPWQGEFTVETALVGHNTTTAGALTTHRLYDLLGIVVGANDSTQEGGTVQTGTSATQFSTTGVTSITGGMLRVGSLGDARGGGQFGVVDDNAGSITLLNALPAAPNSADVVYAGLMVYPREGGTFATVLSTRWLLMTANGQWKARGCFPTSITFSGLNAGEMPRMSITFGVSRWEEANETFPSASAASGTEGHAIVAGGSCFLQDVGTTTRQTFGVRDFSLTINMETQPLLGCGGQDEYQTIVGARRIRSSASFSLLIDSEASGTNTLNDIFTGTDLQHCLMTLSAVDGKAIGFYFPNCRATNYVTQEAVDGLNRRRINFEALTGTDTSNERTMASWRLALA